MSLLTGLIKDAKGRSFTPSHAVKNGKRYRYYVCQSVIREPGSQQRGPVRLPAHDYREAGDSQIAIIHSIGE
jgi:site-specific DNA recombinase